jgi:hypothetical protein
MSRKTLYILLGALSFAGYAWLAWNCIGLAYHAPAPGFCMFKAITHVPCPSCGTTRAVMLLLSGNIAGSLLLNPFGAILFIALVVISLWLLADVLLKRESLYRWYTATEHTLRRNAWILIPLIVLVIANWFWNIAKRL